MAVIKIQRSNEYVNRIRDFKIFIDGQQIGTIANNEIKSFSTLSGARKITVKIDWCSSQEINFDLNENQIKTFKVSGFKGAKWLFTIAMLSVILHFLLTIGFKIEPSSYLMIAPIIAFAFMVYYGTIGRNSYLTLEEV